MRPLYRATAIRVEASLNGGHRLRVIIVAAAAMANKDEASSLLARRARCNTKKQIKYRKWEENKTIQATHDPIFISREQLYLG